MLPLAREVACVPLSESMSSMLLRATSFDANGG